MHYYLIPLFFALLLGLITLVLTQTSEKKMIDKPFLNEWSNELYVMSYSKPFKWFINPDEEHFKVKKIKKLIVEANEAHRLNYRVYVTIQLLTLFLAGLSLLLFSLLANNSVLIFKYLFNVSVNTANPQTMLQVKVVVGTLLLGLTLTPSLFLKHKAKKNKYLFVKDLPILQLFIILMLKAKRPLSEVIYVLSTTNTVYKTIFDTAYRIYIRDKKEGMSYLQDAFMGTKFEETIKVLSEYGEYSKKDTMTVLENGLKDIDEYTNTQRRRKDTGQGVFSQLTLAIPFLSILMLGFAPLLFYGLNLIQV